MLTKNSPKHADTRVHKEVYLQDHKTSIKDMQSAPQLQFRDKLAGSKISKINDDDDGGDDDGGDDNAMNSSDDELLYNAAQAYEEENARRPSPQTGGDVIVISNSDVSDDDLDGTEQEQTIQPPPTGQYTTFTFKFFQHL